MKKADTNKTLIYDDNCPLCKAYTSAFVKGGLLETKNRLAFTEVNMQQFRIDWHRAKHEIPLIDLETGKVWYGVEALTEILKQKFPFVKTLLRVNVFNWFFHQLYKLISYNRKIIIADTEKNKNGFDCTPDYSYTWRWLLFMVSVILSYMFIKTTHIFPDVFMGIAQIKNIIVVISVCFLVLMIGIGKKTATEFFVHTALTLLISSFLVLVIVLLKKIFALDAWSFYALLLIVMLTAIYQLYKRIYFMIKTR